MESGAASSEEAEDVCRVQNERERQSENSCLGAQRLASYYKAIVVSVYVSTDPSESRSISQLLWAWHCQD